ncbi:MAG: Penicillin-binding protein 2 [Microgenomates group bacterium GW2011_GWC1_49_7]|nr:MAG: Penicillin-binding protein 2 [Microgenomates group bacterium GW2011_GWC1_49_7]
MEQYSVDCILPDIVDLAYRIFPRYHEVENFRARKHARHHDRIYYFLVRVELVADSFDGAARFMGKSEDKRSYDFASYRRRSIFLGFIFLSMKLGKAFSDSVIIEKKQEFRRSRDSGDSWWLGAGRALIFTTLLFIAFFILLWRLFDLTIIRGHEFRALADGNRTRELIRHAPRGLLLDRTGRPLTANIPQYRLLKPCEDNMQEDLPAGEAGCTATITKEEGERLIQSGLPPGNFLEVDYQRRYLFDSLSQVTGFTGELGETELGDEYYKLRSYHPGDRIGRSGAEAYFEEKLRGRDGKELVEVDAAGTILRVLGRQEEILGENMTLSVDANLSEAAARAFPAGEKGAVVVTKPATGEILALYSSPAFSANAFSLGLSKEEYEALLTNPDRPMFNRAIGGVYPPGSTFKIVTAIAGIEEEAVKKDTIVEDNGSITIGPFTFPNWYFVQYGKTEGALDIVRAIKRSNDIFFYKVGEWVGITKLAKWAHTLGVGRTLGIELSGEATGLMPGPAWKASQFHSPADLAAQNDEWYLGDTYHVAIGQGYLLTTPLQVNIWTNVVANNGNLCRPTIQKVSSNCKDLSIKKETIELITEGMAAACAPGGTGWPLFGFSASSSGTLTPVPVACKTGTAEFGDPKNHTHAWFTAFGPLPDQYIPKDIKATEGYISGEPEISVTVLVEGAGEGSNVAAPVAKKIFEEWFGR